MTKTTEKVDGISIERFFDENKLILTVEEKLTTEPKELILNGALTSDTAEWLLDELDRFMCIRCKVTVNFAKVTYISPSAIQAFRDNQKNIENFRRGGLVLTKVSDEIYEQMEELGVAGLLMIED